MTVAELLKKIGQVDYKVAKKAVITEVEAEKDTERRETSEALLAQLDEI